MTDDPMPAEDDEVLPATEGDEADLLDQRRVVEEEQGFEPGPRPVDAPEADWFEQRIDEPVDDELR